ncbi:hypothetical protein [Methylobacterium oryzae]|uniref:Uncharacterized protein n=1 Tax=Methylobacterium oryzae TaxID=334852 RepID=A0ABU7THA4_9HYPH
MAGLMRRLGNDGNLSVVLTLGGTMSSLQDGRCAVQGAGDLLVLARRPGSWPRPNPAKLCPWNRRGSARSAPPARRGSTAP